MHIKTQASLAALLLAASATAHAGPGALEINQACVEEGCFPGDDPGFPVTITQPGSYLLTSDIRATDPLGDGIRVESSDVTIDLGDRTIFGPRTCPGNLAECPRDPAAGIHGAGISKAGGDLSITIKNGSVRGFHGWAIAMERDARIYDVNVSDSYVGIGMMSGSIVERCTFVRNDLGIDAIGGMVRDSSFRENRWAGIKTSPDAGGVIEGVDAFGNRLGIEVHGPVLIKSSNFSNNERNGIRIGGGGAMIKDSIVSKNGWSGIAATSDDGQPTYISGSSIIMNERAGANQQVSVDAGATGFVIDGQTMCGTTLGCP